MPSMMREVTSLTGEIVIVDGKVVENVLVEPGERTEADDVTVPAGTIVAYTLRFPADYDGPIADAVIEVRGIECRTVGFSDHYRAREVFGSSWSLPWDMTVAVERVEADMRAEIALVATSCVYEMGRPKVAETTLYEGYAQARMTGGAEDIAPDGSSDPSETWHFVIPWSSDVAGIRPESSLVRMDGIDYDVTSVTDPDGRRTHVSIAAVRRG